MRTTAEGAAGEDAAHVWQRGATRRAILDAARLIAARNGSADFSLNTVAKEAGYSTTTVFAYFSTKVDLFNAIVADDLAGLARQMRESYAFAPQAAVEADPQIAPEETAEQIAEPEVAIPELQAQVSSVVAFAPPTEVKAEAAGEDSAKRPPRADAWLERRLRVFEKSLADIETRLAAAQHDSSRAISVAEETSRIFAARLDTSEKRTAELSNDLTARLTAAEKRLRETQTDLRNNLLNVSMRIDTLESAAQRVASDAGYVLPVAPVVEPVSVPEPEAVREKPLTAAADSYLSAARRAAQTAAALSAMEQRPRQKKFNFLRFDRRMAIIVAVTLAAFIVGGTVSYALGVHAGRSTLVRVVVPRAFLHHGVADAAPLDRLTELADAGNAKAELLVGLRYLKGLGTPIDEPRAAKWIARAAAARDPLALYWMGHVYEHGEGVSADAAEALRWYEAAAIRGNRKAMYDLGVANAEGLGTQKDLVQSAAWFAKAAALGLTNAQFNLAVLYERGEGVKQSLADAYKWYSIAAANGDAESKARVDAIATQISPADLAAAKSAVDLFKPVAPDRNANTISNKTARSGA